MGQVLRLYIFAALLLWPLSRGVWNELMVNTNSVIVFLAISLAIWFAYELSKRNGNTVVQIIFVLVLTLIAQWGLLQFILQGDLGLYLIGESRLSVGEEGVAKFAGPGTNKLMRAYGPYLHANVFGGVMVIGLMVWARLALYINNNFKGVTHASSHPTPKATEGRQHHIQPGLPAEAKATASVFPALLMVGFFILLGLILSFSRAAWLGGVGVGFVTWLSIRHRRGVTDHHPSLLPSNTAGKPMPAVAKAMAGRQGEGIKFRNLLFILLIVLLTLSPLILTRMSDVEDVAYQERIAASRWSISLSGNTNVWRGVGPGNYIPALEKELIEHDILYQPWQLDYVHSVPLLLIAEWGLLMVSLVLLGLVWLMVKYFATQWYWVLPMLPMLLFDHYFITQLGPAVILGMGLVLVGNRTSGDTPEEVLHFRL